MKLSCILCAVVTVFVSVGLVASLRKVHTKKADDRRKRTLKTFHGHLLSKRSPELLNYQQDAVKVINKFREIHDTPPLVSDAVLQQEAKELANALASSGKMFETTKKKLTDYKKGLYQVACVPEDTIISPDEAIENWYREVCASNINFTSNDESQLKNAPHFSQLVWKDSLRVGVAYATRLLMKKYQECTVVVAKFDPPGEIDGNFIKNVNQGKFEKSFCNGISSIGSSALSEEFGTQPVNNNPLVPTNASAEAMTNPEDIFSLEQGTLAQNPQEVQPQGGQPSSGLGFEEEALTAHNIFRKLHSAPLMKLDPQMSTQAQEYAQKLATRGILKHASKKERNEDGENLAMACSSDMNSYAGYNPVVAWYAEVCSLDYKFDSRSLTRGAGHFTQVIWRDSTQLGIGKATMRKDDMDCVYTVARYRKAGNNFSAKVTTQVRKGSFTPEKVCGVVTNNNPSMASLATLVGKNPGGLYPTTETNLEQRPVNGLNPIGGLNPSGGKLKERPAELNPISGKLEERPGELNPTASRLGISFEEEALNAHNKLRELHNTPAMQLNPTMSREAAAYAQQIANKGSLDHSQNSERNGDGENLAMQCASPTLGPYTGDKPVIDWYFEVCNPGYTFGSTAPNSVTGHFTQVIWRESTEIGIGKAYVQNDENHCVYVVARYRKAGNMMGKYKENVNRGSFKLDKVCDLVNAAKNGGPFPNFEGLISEKPPEIAPSIDADAGNPDPLKSGAKENTGNVQSGQVVDDSFEEEALNAHNKLRELHNTPAMQLNPTMSREAAAYAQKIANKHSLDHSQTSERNGDGENLAMQCASPTLGPYPGDKPVIDWYFEVCNPGYTFGSTAPNSVTGHFTQVIWRESTEIGIGKAYVQNDENHCVYVVARYRKAGNMMGKYKENVNRGSFKLDKVCDLVNAAKNGGPFPNFEGLISEKPPEIAPSTDADAGNPDPLNSGAKENTGNVQSGQVVDNSFEEEALNAHNKLRELHNTPAMQLNPTMSREAAAYAQKIANKHSLDHSQTSERNGDGENLAMQCASPTLGPYPGDKPVIDWYFEVCNPGYTFGSTSPNSVTGHFTQVIWRESTEMGIGKAYVQNDEYHCVYVVARYRKAGNMMGKYKENVNRGGFTRYYCSPGKIDELLNAKKRSWS